MTGSDWPDDQPTQRLDEDAAEPPRDAGPAVQPPRRWGRDLLIGTVGALLGFVLAFVVVALGSGDPPDDGEHALALERIEALEAELVERDARLAALEAQLADAEAAAGQRAEDVEAQRQALDDRAAALDDRARALDDREAALDRREADITDREAADEPEGPAPPAIDREAAETLIDRILEQLRELFQRGGS